jgi:hypothetical protein
MSLNEALIYLNANNIEELPSKIEYEVFEIKRFFFSNNFHPKLAFVKTQKLRKILTIQQNFFRSVKDAESNPLNELEYIIQGDEIIDCIQQYNLKKSQLFFEMHNTYEIIHLISCIERLTKLFLSYGNKWPIFPIDKKDLKLTKEMDSMSLLDQVRSLNKNGIIYFNELKDNDAQISCDLMHESTRLKSIAFEFILANPQYIST